MCGTCSCLESPSVLTRPLTRSCDLGKLLTPQNLLSSVPGGGGSTSEPPGRRLPSDRQTEQVEVQPLQSEQGRGSCRLGLNGFLEEPR